MILATSRHAIDYSDSIRSMLGYSITPPFMGYVDGRHPMKVLNPDFDPASTGDGGRSQVFWDETSTATGYRMTLTEAAV
jgi:hypothetical protein